MSAVEGDVVGFRAASVGAWYAEHLPGAEPPLRAELLAGGHSNLTYRVVDAAGAVTVLRRPPTGSVLATAHDMAREHRIISGVGQTSVPVPPALGLCTDTDVNDAPFYVMGYVEGVVLDEAAKVEDFFGDPALRDVTSASVVEVLAALHSVDPDTVGLGELGRKEAYLERQLKRWRTQWEKSKTRDLPAMEQVADALERHRPDQQGAGIVHGDYRLGNMLTAPDGTIAAVLDWELCTLGDVMADVGYIMNNWAAPGEEGVTSRGAAQAPTAAGGFWSRERFLERYRDLTGRSTDNVDYYRAFQYWRLAAIVEGVLSRYLQGVMGAEADTDQFRDQVDGLAAAAHDLVRPWG